MSNNRITLLQHLPGMVFVLLAGCGSHGPQMAEVAGTVTIDGEPLAKAILAFAPESGERVASGLTDEEGRYRLSTFSIEDGAIVGKHQVTVTARGPHRPARSGLPGTGSSLGPKLPGIALIPERYFDQNTSGLTAVVEYRKTNEFNFSLSSSESSE